jgi:hypothetical protein
LELKHFKYAQPDVSPPVEVFVSVQSFERVPEKGAACGSVVVLQTSHGKFTLDDDHLYLNDQAVDATGLFADQTRRLHSGYGRRLQQAALQGFYNFVDKTDFPCTSEWQGEEEQLVPEPPKTPYSYTNFLHQSCISMVTGKNQCIRPDGIVLPGVSDDQKTIMRVEKVLVTDLYQVEVQFLPNAPMQRKVTVTRKNDTVVMGKPMAKRIKYQVFEYAPSVLYCYQELMDQSVGMNADIDGYLSYIGTATHRFRGSEVQARRWTVMPNDEDGGFGKDLDGIQFWDTEDEKLPLRLFAPSGKLLDNTYTDFRVALNTTHVEAWMAEHLLGTSPDDPSCSPAEPRVTAAKAANITYNVPPMNHVFVNSDRPNQFYMDHYRLGFADEEEQWWPDSYEQYWSSQLAKGAATEAKCRAASKVQDEIDSLERQSVEQLQEIVKRLEEENRALVKAMGGNASSSGGADDARRLTSNGEHPGRRLVELKKKSRNLA